MPEKEARPPAQNRHGGAPRGERVPLDARRASLGTARRAPKRATTGILRLSALRSPLLGWMEKRKSKTRARKRAAGTREAGLDAKISRVGIARLRRFHPHGDTGAMPTRHVNVGKIARGPHSLRCHGTRFCPPYRSRTTPRA